MCGRFTLSAGLPEVIHEFDIEEVEGEWTPRYNIAPMQEVPVVVLDEAHHRSLTSRRWGLVLVWMAFIALLSHQTEVKDLASRSLAVPDADRLDHLADYAVLGALPWPPLMVALLIGFVYGVLDELYQSFVPGRDGDVFDWVAEPLGVALGW